MRLSELAQGLGLDPKEASDRLWHLGIIAETSTILSGRMLSAARDHLATFAVQPPPEVVQPHPKVPTSSDDSAPMSSSEPVKAAKALNIAPPAGPHRVFELAQATGISAQALISAAERIGMTADHVTRLTETDISALWVALAGQKTTGVTEQKVARSVKRRRKVQSD